MSQSAYKIILAEIIARRPSGTRQRLATALGRNRSFVSQITNPAYATPIPAVHLEAIFDVCHFTATERRAFLDLYRAAHPKHSIADSNKTRAVYLPDLGDDERNRKLQSLVSDFVRHVAQLMDKQPAKRERR